MKETQACRKCGRVFAEMTRSGPSHPLFLTSDIMRRSGITMCPSCGGKVAWTGEQAGPTPGPVVFVVTIIVVALIVAFVVWLA